MKLFSSSLTSVKSILILLMMLSNGSDIVAQDRLIHWQKPGNYAAYAPLTTHYFRGDLKVSHLSSINYGWLELGFFINSYRDPTVAICYKTEILETPRWRFHLMAGTGYGYKKQLFEYPTIPLSGTILFRTDFIPVGGATIEYYFSEKLAVKATLIPLVGGLGLQYQF